mgnify:CR=1 FL=1
MGDPGLQGARECVSIPVIGPCETAMHFASMLGHKFSVLTVLERTVPLIENLSVKLTDNFEFFNKTEMQDIIKNDNKNESIENK